MKWRKIWNDYLPFVSLVIFALVVFAVWWLERAQQEVNVNTQRVDTIDEYYFSTRYTVLGWNQMSIEYDGGSDGHTMNVVTFVPYYENTMMLLRFPGLGVREYCWAGGAWHEEEQAKP